MIIGALLAPANGANVAKAAGSAVPPYDALFLVGGTPSFARLVNETAATSTFATLPPADMSSVAIRVTTTGGTTSWPWTLSFTAPTGSDLAVGSYPGAELIAREGVPGVDIYGGDGYGCGMVAGEFDVLELSRGSDDVVTAFAADFSLRCTEFFSSPDRVLSGELRFRSTVGWHGWSSSATAIDFGGQAVGATSLPGFVTITNVGTLPLSLDATISGLSEPEFAVADPNQCLSEALDPGAACAVGATYSPWRTGESTGQLKVSRNGDPGLFLLALTGAGRSTTNTDLIIVPPAAWPLPAAMVNIIVTPDEGGYAEIINISDGRRLGIQGVGYPFEFEFPLPLPPGPIDLIARYLGSETGLPSESAITHLNVPVATAVELATRDANVRMGEPVDLYATVQSPGSFRLTGGTLSIVDVVSGETLVTMPVTDDRPEARVQVRLFEAIQFHAFEARYSGSGPFAASTARVDVSVQGITTTEADAPAQVPEGAAVTITGEVHSPMGTDPIGGHLELRDEAGALINRAPVTAANHRIESVLRLQNGTHRFDVTYTGTDRHAASTDSVVVTVGGQPDSVPPTGTVRINDGAAYTRLGEVTLRLSATDPSPGTGVARMQFRSSEMPGVWTTPEPYATTKGWTFAAPDGAKQIFARFLDGAGNTSVASGDTVVFDSTPPQSDVPKVGLVRGIQVAPQLVPVLITFPAQDVTSGVRTYALSESTDGGSTWTAVALSDPSASQTMRYLQPGATVRRFRVQATDAAGNVGSWAQGDAFSVLKVEDRGASVAYTGRWAKKSNANASGRKFRMATRKASAVVSFTGTAAGLVFRVGPNCGKVALYLDSSTTPIETIDLYSPSVGWRHVAYTVSFAGPGAHRLMIRALGTRNAASTATQVPFDAVVVLR